MDDQEHCPPIFYRLLWTFLRGLNFYKVFFAKSFFLPKLLFVRSINLIIEFQYRSEKLLLCLIYHPLRVEYPKSLFDEIRHFYPLMNVQSLRVSTQNKRLEKVHNACIKFNFSTPRFFHITPYRNQINLFTVENRRLYFLISFIFLSIE